MRHKSIEAMNKQKAISNFKISTIDGNLNFKEGQIFQTNSRSYNEWGMQLPE